MTKTKLESLSRGTTEAAEAFSENISALAVALKSGDLGGFSSVELRELQRQIFLLARDANECGCVCYAAIRLAESREKLPSEK